MHLAPSPRLIQSFPVTLDALMDWALKDECRGVGHRPPPDLHGIWQRVLVHARLDCLVTCEQLPPTVSVDASRILPGIMAWERRHPAYKALSVRRTPEN